MTSSAHRGGVVTLGETMALVASTSFGPLQHSHTMHLGIGGSESNVAIALSRLGTEVTWIGKVGADSLGDLVVREIGAEGVHVVAPRDPDAPTALMVKEYRTSVDTHVWYYRKNNAGSRLRADEVDPDIIRNAALLHVTGISPGLSETMAHTVDEAIRIAKDAGTIVSFDLNFRGKVWSRQAAHEAYLRIIPQADIVFAGDDEAAIAVGNAETPLQLAHRLVDAGAGQAIVKLGARGAVAVVDGIDYERAAVKVPVVDTVGAGDAFVAGYLADLLLGEDVPARLTTAVTVGAYACLTNGDWEGTPRRHELALLGGVEPVSR
ncbi:sugar kinase [Parafrigoribacterium mesophilum]|uniref:sugar kinase n=1 Tax=Parafrigoribacterium mesophilum TaxID=433646 RepID=UPI0031FCBC38